jgi:hypothetical protein
MKQVSIAIAVAAVASVAVCATSQAAPVAQLPAAATTGTDHLVAYMYNGQSYAYRWHGHYYNHRYWRHGRYYYR